MKKTGVVTAVVLAGIWLTGAAQARGERGQVPAFGLEHLFPRPVLPPAGFGKPAEVHKNEHTLLDWLMHARHLVPHSMPGSAPSSYLPKGVLFRPWVPLVTAEMVPPSAFKVGVSGAVPEVVSRAPVLRAGWFRGLGSGKGILRGIGGAIAAGLGGLFGRRKNSAS
jgi:hypothetical protein